MLRTGARPMGQRRLQRDTLFDTMDGTLKARGCALRVRREGDRTVLTFKGPAQAGPMKTREEHETVVADEGALLAVLDGLGYRPWFRYEKFREEYESPGVIIAVDETPVGTFVEIEGEEGRILEAAGALGCAADDFVRSSYRQLFLELGQAAGMSGPDMLFPSR